ncbi:MAG TPA: membrane protein insertase YidC [Jiangellales bacterium]|nr:membrane protein insertase YidC [Jiangellales bacterium]
MDTLLSPLLYVVSWIMIGWHALFATVLGIDDALSWTLSIVGLVVVIRILLIPLFVRQIKASRAMAMLQPQMRELQKKYGSDRERMSQEMMKLYKETGTNPFASCLPILLQAPFFFSLFRVLDGIAVDVPRGAFTSQEALFESARQATLLGVPLSSSFRQPIPPGLPADITATINVTGVQVVAGVLVAIMVATTFLTQRQLMRKNMPASALEGPFAQQQKILLYVLPLTFLFSGYFFPIGVVLYWCVSNLWTMGQQFYVIRRMPAPGTPAEEAYKRRLAAKAARRGGTPPAPTPEPGGTGPTTTAAPPPPPRPPGRQQPKRTTRAQRKGTRKS